MDERIDREEPDFYDWDDLRQRIVGLESQIGDTQNKEVEKELDSVRGEVSTLEDRFDSLEYNLKKNLEEIVYALKWSVELRDLPNIRWNREIRS